MTTTAANPLTPTIPPRLGFKAGEKVRCTRATSAKLVEGQEYLVTEGGRHIIRLEGVTSYQYAYRFTKA